MEVLSELETRTVECANDNDTIEKLLNFSSFVLQLVFSLAGSIKLTKNQSDETGAPDTY